MEKKEERERDLLETSQSGEIDGVTGRVHVCACVNVQGQAVKYRVRKKLIMIPFK